MVHSMGFGYKIGRDKHSEAAIINESLKNSRILNTIEQ